MSTMQRSKPSPTALPAWGELARHHAAIADTSLRELFAADPTRGERLTAEGVGLYLDFSKNRITDETLALLLALAEQAETRGAQRRRCSPVSASTSRRTARCCTSRCACPAPPRSCSMGWTSWVRFTRCSTAWPRFSRPGSLGRVDRPHRQAHHERRQHRHRRLRPRPGDGV